MFIFLLFGRGACFCFFAVWAGCVFLFFAVWAGGVFFLWFGRVGVFVFLLFGRGSCFFPVWAGGGGRFFFCFFLLFGRVRVHFLLFGRWVCLFFCCLGGGHVFFLAVWAGDGSSLTYRSAWLVFKRPNNKKDQTAKTTHTGSHGSLVFSTTLHNRSKQPSARVYLPSPCFAELAQEPSYLGGKGLGGP